MLSVHINDWWEDYTLIKNRREYYVPNFLENFVFYPDDYELSWVENVVTH